MEDEVIDLTPWWQLEGVEAPVVCNVSPSTGEFIGIGLADPSPLEPGVWLIPAHSYQVSPPETDAGFAAVAMLNGAMWKQIPDHRGTTVYSTETGETQVWDALGDLPHTVTLQAPASEFDKWQEDEWVLDEAAQLKVLRQAASKKKYLFGQYTSNMVALLQDAVDMEIASDKETTALQAWKVYRIELSRVDTTESAPAADDWPKSPDDAAMAAWLQAQGFEDPATTAT